MIFTSYIIRVSLVVYSISSVWKIDTPNCMFIRMTKVKDYIFVLCYVWDFNMHTIRAYEDSIPHDLLFIIITDKFPHPNIIHLAGIENTNTLYIGDWRSDCIWKVDIDNNRVDKW